jgi:hypothetical protein
MAFPGASRVVVTPGPVVKVKIGRFRSQYSRAGVEGLTAGIVTKSVSFTTPLPDTNYVVQCTIGNYSDNPDTMPLITAHPTQLTANGFTVRLSGATLTDNYKLHWSIAEVFSP